MKPKILIVDDEPAILYALQVFLKQQGYEVKTVTGYHKFLEKAAVRDLPDVIILDVLLQEEDGRAVAKKLKANSKTRHIPIIMISAHPSADKMALKSGADAFLAKPFDASILTSIINRLYKPHPNL